MKIISQSALIFMALLTITSGCKKLIELDAPTNQVISTEVFKSDSTAQSAVLGIYSDMMSASEKIMSSATTLYASLSSNQLIGYTPGVRDEFAGCEIGLASHPVLNSAFWGAAYRYIYAANLCHERLVESEINPALKKVLLGEVLFLRAMCYFNLVNFFGDVPLITSTDHRTTANQPRASVAEIYDRLVADLQQAADYLPETFTGVNRVRATRWAAIALLARIHLYRQEWQKAADAASIVIDKDLFTLTPLSGVFLKNSTEAIFQLMPVSPSWNTWESRDLLPASANETPKFMLSERLLQAFEAGDERKAVWISSRMFNGQTVYYPTKYKAYANTVPVTEYYMVLRLAEQYLIRAEARAHLLQIADGAEDLNMTRRRAGLPDAVPANSDELLQLLEKERELELFLEWGHRWFDLKRTGRINDVMSAIHPNTWNEKDALYPIPIDQLNLNHNLTQNPGY